MAEQLRKEILELADKSRAAKKEKKESLKKYSAQNSMLRSTFGKRMKSSVDFNGTQKYQDMFLADKAIRSYGKGYQRLNLWESSEKMKYRADTFLSSVGLKRSEYMKLFKNEMMKHLKPVSLPANTDFYIPIEKKSAKKKIKRKQLEAEYTTLTFNNNLLSAIVDINTVRAGNQFIDPKYLKYVVTKDKNITFTVTHQLISNTHHCYASKPISIQNNAVANAEGVVPVTTYEGLKVYKFEYNAIDIIATSAVFDGAKFIADIEIQSLYDNKQVVTFAGSNENIGIIDEDKDEKSIQNKFEISVPLNGTTYCVWDFIYEGNAEQKMTQYIFSTVETSQLRQLNNAACPFLKENITHKTLINYIKIINGDVATDIIKGIYPGYGLIGYIHKEIKKILLTFKAQKLSAISLESIQKLIITSIDLINILESVESIKDIVQHTLSILAKLPYYAGSTAKKEHDAVSDFIAKTGKIYIAINTWLVDNVSAPGGFAVGGGPYDLSILKSLGRESMYDKAQIISLLVALMKFTELLPPADMIGYAKESYSRFDIIPDLLNITLDYLTLRKIYEIYRENITDLTKIKNRIQSRKKYVTDLRTSIGLKFINDQNYKTEFKKNMLYAYYLLRAVVTRGLLGDECVLLVIDNDLSETFISTYTGEPYSKIENLLKYIKAYIYYHYQNTNKIKKYEKLNSFVLTNDSFGDWDYTDTEDDKKAISYGVNKDNINYFELLVYYTVADSFGPNLTSDELDTIKTVISNDERTQYNKGLVTKARPDNVEHKNNAEKLLKELAEINKKIVYPLLYVRDKEATLAAITREETDVLKDVKAKIEVDNEAKQLLQGLTDIQKKEVTDALGLKEPYDENKVFENMYRKEFVGPNELKTLTAFSQIGGGDGATMVPSILNNAV